VRRVAARATLRPATVELQYQIAKIRTFVIQISLPRGLASAARLPCVDQIVREQDQREQVGGADDRDQRKCERTPRRVHPLSIPGSRRDERDEQHALERGNSQ